MPTKMLWVEHMQILFWILDCIKLTTYVIAESMDAQYNIEENEYLLLDLLIDCQKNDIAISISNQQISIWGKPMAHKSTAGWQSCCQLKDGSISLEKMSDLKESHPVQTDEFAIAQGVNHEPDFE